jgi:transaldolase
MKVFIDTANLAEIREVHSWGVLAGVTTNPSLIAREGGDFITTIHEICELVQGPVSAEVVAQDTPGMLREGRLLARVHPEVVVKVPLTTAGLAACRALSDEGTRVNVTLCFQAGQALLAALAGATYISPFVGRLDDTTWNGVELIEQIAAIYDNDPDIETQILSASIRHPMHFVQSAMAGAHVATVPFKVLQQLMQHPLTDKGNEGFLKDWAKVPDTDISAQVERWLARRGGTR